MNTLSWLVDNRTIYFTNGRVFMEEIKFIRESRVDLHPRLFSPSDKIRLISVDG